MTTHRCDPGCRDDDARERGRERKREKVFFLGLCGVRSGSNGRRRVEAVGGGLHRESTRSSERRDRSRRQPCRFWVRHSTAARATHYLLPCRSSFPPFPFGKDATGRSVPVREDRPETFSATSPRSATAVAHAPTSQRRSCDYRGAGNRRAKRCRGHRGDRMTRHLSGRPLTSSAILHLRFRLRLRLRASPAPQTNLENTVSNRYKKLTPTVFRSSSEIKCHIYV